MKKTRKLISLLMALAMIFALAIPAFAADLTINNTNAGETYSVYQIFTATSSDDGTSTTYYISTSNAYYDDVQQSNNFTLVSTGDSTKFQVTWDEANVTEDQLKAELVGYGAQGDAVTTETGNGGTVTISGLDAGYYYITTTTGTAVSIGNTGETTIIADKNKEPVPTKTVADTENADGSESNTAGIGDTVYYSVEIADAGDVTNLIYHDTMTDGLTFDSSSVVVKAGETALIENDDYKILTGNDLTDDCTFEIEFTAAGLAKITGSVTITYSATVNEKAKDTNGNAGKVTYGDGGQTSTETKTETKVYDFDLTKVDNKDNSLTASFTLADSDNNLISFVEVEGGYRVATAEEKTGDSATTTISAGTVNIFGLDAGTYTLTETEAPAGYNQLTSAITVVIDENGNVTLKDGSDANGSMTDDGVKVVNNAGAELPSTGGMGTTLFYIFGGALVLCAVVLLVTRRRMDNEQ